MDGDDGSRLRSNCTFHLLQIHLPRFWLRIDENRLRAHCVNRRCRSDECIRGDDHLIVRANAYGMKSQMKRCSAGIDGDRVGHLTISSKGLLEIGHWRAVDERARFQSRPYSSTEWLSKIIHLLFKIEKRYLQRGACTCQF